MMRSEVLHEAEKIVLGDRQEQYGNPEDNFKKIAELWSIYLGYPVSEPNVADMMILLKVARNSTGHYKADNYVDICGYAACASEIQGKTVFPDDGLII